MKRNFKSILHINTNDVKGGAAKVPWRLAEAQREVGMDSKMLVGYKESDSPFTFPFSIDADVVDYSLCQNEGWLDYHLSGSFKLLNHPFVARADILHLHNLHGGFFNPFSLPFFAQNKPTVWTLHDMQAFTGHCAYSIDCNKWIDGCGECPNLGTYPSIKVDSTKLLLEHKKEIYNLSSLVIVTPSDWLRKFVQKSILKNQPVELIYNGVDITRFKLGNRKVAREKFGIEDGKFVIGCVANGGSFTDKRKGGYFIKEVIDYLASRNENFVFLNIGANEAFEQEDYIINTGYITNEEDLTDIYNTFDIFLFPSIADNCPLVLSEALSCGIPTITFNTGGIPELIRHGIDGFVADYQNVEQLISYTECLIRNEDLRNQMRWNAREHAVKEFNHDLISKKYLDVYEQVSKDFYAKKGKTPCIDMKNFPPIIQKKVENLERNKKLPSAPNKEPNVLILVENESENNLDKQTYPFKRISNINKFKVLSSEIAEVVLIADEKAQFSLHFLEQMLYEYNGEDVITTTFCPVRKDGTRFYRNISPYIIKNGKGYILQSYSNAVTLYNKDFYIKNFENILGNEPLYIENFKSYVMDMASLPIRLYLLDKLEKFMVSSLYIYGAGTHTVDLIESVFADSQIKIKGIIDRNIALRNQKFLGNYPIYHVSDMKSLSIETLLISSASYEEEIYYELKDSKFEVIKIYN